MQGDKNNPHCNGEGYPDPTAYRVIKKDTAEEIKAKFVIKILKFITNESGYEVRKIEIYKSGRIYK